MTENKDHWIHPWAGTIVAAITIFGVVAGGATAWSDANNRLGRLDERVSFLEGTIKKLRPEPTVHEQQCNKILGSLTAEMSNVMSTRIRDFRDLAIELKCLPSDSSGR